MAEYIVEKKQTSGGWTWAEPKGKLIRCKDCRYYKKKYGGVCKAYVPEILGKRDNDYCSQAERKEE